MNEKKIVRTLPQVRENYMLAYCQSLFVAIDEGEVELALELLIKGADLSSFNEDGLTPLHYAVKNGKTEMIEMLLNQGADVNQRCCQNQGPSVNICSEVKTNRNQGYKQRSRQQSQPVDDVPSFGTTALLIAVEEGSLELVKLLLRHGADTVVKNEKRENCLMIAARRASAQPETYRQLLKVLLDSGADLTSDRTLEYIVLDRVLLHGGLESFLLLLERGVDIINISRSSRSLLSAAMNKDCGILKWLLERNYFDLERKNVRGETALHLAVEANLLVTAECLLEYGAKLESCSNDGLTPRDLAIYSSFG
ncbi:uncharacterized protein LOC106637064 [Copidosoma floridanum]|uniref:uncharacterized protein LOC106637064 n=1 Tax=Copidosoma floridanum TaxID=29053 RepID=UPI0006C9625F|nr:uncharacterized protein LOC106637064 [Copidosoma floridanum]